MNINIVLLHLVFFIYLRTLLSYCQLYFFIGAKMVKNNRIIFTKPMQVKLFDENDDGSLKNHKTN
jgi:hypothetical protein